MSHCPLPFCRNFAAFTHDLEPVIQRASSYAFQRQFHKHPFIKAHRMQKFYLNAHFWEPSRRSIVIYGVKPMTMLSEKRRLRLFHPAKHSAKMRYAGCIRVCKRHAALDPDSL